METLFYVSILLLVILLIIQPRFLKIEAVIVEIKRGPEIDEYQFTSSDNTFLYTDIVRLKNENFEEFTAYLNKNMLKNKKIGDSIKIEGINFKPRIKIFRKYFEKKFFPFF